MHRHVKAKNTDKNMKQKYLSSFMTIFLKLSKKNHFFFVHMKLETALEFDSWTAFNPAKKAKKDPAAANLQYSRVL